MEQRERGSMCPMTACGARQMSMLSRQLFKAIQPVSQSVGLSRTAAHLKLQRLKNRVLSRLWLTEGVTAELGRILLGQRCVLSAFLSSGDACLCPHPGAAAPHIRAIVRSAAQKKMSPFAMCHAAQSLPPFFFLRLSLITRWKVRTEAGRQLRAPTEGSGFGYGGAGPGPIGLERFEWASLEQSQAPPNPSRRKPS